MMNMDISTRILSDITVHMKYGKYLDVENRRETWGELVTRNKEMHQKHYPNLKDEIDDVYKFVYERKVLPSMRSMQFAGKPIEISPNRLYNCAYLPINDWRAFSETMFLLLGGTGVGYSVQKHHITELPDIRKPNPKRNRRYVIGDSIEGWADAIKLLMKSYFDIYDKNTSTPIFDFSDIRVKGARLVTSGGKAPGPQPLKDCIHKITGILSHKEDGDSLSTLEVHDIVCYIADAVLAGGIRRAALISLFSFDDMEMRSCKVGNWYEMNPQRGRSNNSAVMLRHKIKREEFMELWEKIESSGAGEPGVYFSNDKDWGCNPCCFVGNTNIQCEDNKKTIKEIVNILDDGGVVNIKTFNEETKEVEVKNVLAGQLSKKNSLIVKLTIGENGVKHIVKCTSDHQFYTVNRGWVEAKDLIESDDIIIYDTLKKIGKLIEIEFLKEKEDVYDIQVDGNHNFFANNILAHNCEIALRPYQFCNLCEVNVADTYTQDDLNERVKAAAFIGTLQAGYTDFHYLRDIWQRTTEKDGLIGVGMTGIGSGAVMNLDLKEAAEIVKVENIRVADLIGINYAARTTTVKPSGCQIPSTEIKTNRGVMSLNEIFKANDIDLGSKLEECREWYDVKEDIKVYNNLNEEKSITKLFINGYEETIEFTMDDGSIIECTPNHQFMMVDGSWKEARDITENDDFLIK